MDFSQQFLPCYNCRDPVWCWLFNLVESKKQLLIGIAENMSPLQITVGKIFPRKADQQRFHLLFQYFTALVHRDNQTRIPAKFDIEHKLAIIILVQIFPPIQFTSEVFFLGWESRFRILRSLSRSRSNRSRQNKHFDSAMFARRVA